jgi:hypothetical protein
VVDQDGRSGGGGVCSFVGWRVDELSTAHVL